MLQHYSKIPLELETLTNALIRVAVAQVIRDYRHNPHRYASHPPTAVYTLAEQQRSTLPGLATFGHLVYVSKALQAGFKLKEIASYGPKAVWRAIHKRKVGAKR